MTPDRLRRLAFDFREARALQAGVELGVFERLGAERLSANELAEVLALDARGAAILLDALTAIGALERSGEAYAVPSALRATLVPGHAEYAGNLLLHDLWHWSSWAHLDSAVRDGAAWQRHDGQAHLADPCVLQRFLPNYVMAMEQSDGGAAGALARRLAALAPARILDLGGGSGRMLLALLEALPGARGTLVEHAFSIPRARELARACAASARLVLVCSDFETDEIPAGHDLIALSRVLMGMTPARARALVGRAADALPPGGALAIHDFDAGTRVGALLSLDMLLNCGGGVHARAVVEAWLAEAGLALESKSRLLPYTRLWIARKPA